MTQPNADLMERFGTRAYYKANLEKRAEAPTLLRMMGSLGTGALMASDSADQARQEAEAHLLNRLLREAEARRQSGVVGGLSGSSRAFSASGQAAQQLNDMSAYQSMMSLMKQSSAEMRKEALMPLLAAGAKALAGVGTKAKSTLGSLVKTPSAMAAKAPGIGATQGVAQQAQAKASKPLIGLKGKLLMGGAALGTGYAGAKAVGAAKDYMMQPTYTSNAWGGSGTLRGGVNEFGYANPY